MRTGVIVGRFQLDNPHWGHLDLISKVRNLCDKLVIVIGSARVGYTDKNPIPAQFRVEMLSEFMGYNVDILTIEDNKSDVNWSKNLDTLLTDYENITLYGCRDSFLSSYIGKYNTIHLEPNAPQLSATGVRKDIASGNRITNNQSFRRGIIYAVENRYPTVYPTVDIAIMRSNIDILLARKPGEEKWVFPGGFVDPSDNTLSDAAIRELAEEVINIRTYGMTYVTSMKINDWRYRNTKDGIMTTLFRTDYIEGDPIPGDDLKDGELMWFSLYMNDETIDKVFSDHHKELYKELIKNL